tara:strand:+ start:19202 stop:19681 length:480 start_codon:yes stop_codon:yes gene_type:complete
MKNFITSFLLNKTAVIFLTFSIIILGYFLFPPKWQGGVGNNLEFFFKFNCKTQYSILGLRNSPFDPIINVDEACSCMLKKIKKKWSPRQFKRIIEKLEKNVDFQLIANDCIAQNTQPSSIEKKGKEYMEKSIDDILEKSRQESVKDFIEKNPLKLKRNN